MSVELVGENTHRHLCDSCGAVIDDQCEDKGHLEAESDELCIACEEEGSGRAEKTE